MDQSIKARDDAKKLVDNGRFDEEGVLRRFEDSVRVAQQLTREKFCEEQGKRGKYDIPER